MDRADDARPAASSAPWSTWPRPSCCTARRVEAFDAVVTDVDDRGARVQLADLAVVGRVAAHRVQPGDALRVRLESADPAAADGSSCSASAEARLRGCSGMTALDDLVTLLDLEAIEVNIFRGRSPDENRQRVFGGQVAGQALVAATAPSTSPNRMVHSLHAYFLRPGDPIVPILYEVDRIRDGRSFSTRRVVAIQHGRAIFNLQASFHDSETGPDHQVPMPDGLPSPDSLPDFKTSMAPFKERMGEWYERPRPIDLRHIDGAPFSPRGQRRPTVSGCGCAPTGDCPTTRPCTPASSRTRAT